MHLLHANSVSDLHQQLQGLLVQTTTAVVDSRTGNHDCCKNVLRIFGFFMLF
jgi:hypothetical protein